MYIGLQQSTKRQKDHSVSIIHCLLSILSDIPQKNGREQFMLSMTYKLLLIETVYFTIYTVRHKKHTKNFLS